MAYSLLMTGFTQPDSMPATMAAWRLVLQKISGDEDLYPHLCPLCWAGSTQSYTANACLHKNTRKFDWRWQGLTSGESPFTDHMNTAYECKM